MSLLWLRQTAWLALLALMLATAPLLPSSAQQPPAAPPASATPPPAPVVVMVDMQQLVYSSKAGKGVQAQMDKQRQAFSKEVAQQEDQLQKARAEIERQRGSLTAAQLEAKGREFQKKLQELDRNVQAKQRAWQQVYTEAMGKIEEQALRIVAEIANEHKANLVVQKAAVIFAKDGFDITQEAMVRLDERLPSVTVNQPKPVETGKADTGKGKAAPRSPASAQPPAEAEPPALPPLDLQLRSAPSGSPPQQ